MGRRTLSFVAAALLMLGLLSTARPLAAQAHADQSKILALENVWNLAIVHKDTRALEQLLAANFVGTDFDSTLMNKAQFIASIGDKNYHPQQMVNEATDVRLHPDSAVVTGIYREKGINNGKPYDFRARFTDTWIFENGEWRCAASHSTILTAKQTY
ncbi:MAG TPA: nuclear transport factor 2 family protein [Terriglobales bacterium]|nr:nuclear transport factor 2 family protein [Terriglobales bacterium]